jgi:hypothetical protein
MVPARGRALAARALAVAVLVAWIGLWAVTAGVAAATGIQTAEDIPVVIDQFHIIVSPEGDLMRVAEVYLLGNPTDEVYPNDDGLSLVFPLPEGALQVTYDGAGDGSGPYRRVGDGIAETRPVPPGVARLETRFAYQLPFTEGARVAHTMPLPMQSGVLLVAGTSWKLGARELEAGAYADLGVMEFGGEFARTYMIASLEAGDMLAFEIVAEDAPLSELVGQAAGMAGEVQRLRPGTGLELGLGIVSVVAAAALSYGWWRGVPAVLATPLQSKSAGWVPGPPPEAVLSDLHAIAELDAQYAEGQVDAPAYRRLRQGLKARVRTVLEEAARDDRNPRTD